LIVGYGIPTFKTVAQDDSDEEDLFENLTIHSPQGKRARQQQRRKNARNLRNLLESDKIFDKAAALASKETVNDGESESEGVVKAENGRGSINNQQEQASRTSLKTARMMRGKVTKAQKRALAAAEAMEEVEKELVGKDDTELNNDAPPRATRKSGKKSLILRRGREDESEEEEEEGMYSDEFTTSAIQHTQDDDEWASDVDSAEYGLGDGYMDEVDVM